MHTEIIKMEERLRIAMLTSNVEALDVLIHDRLLFIGPDGEVYHKTDDLELHRTGQIKFTRIELTDLQIESYGSTAITVALVNLAGTYKGKTFEGCSRYSRTWMYSNQQWRIISGSVCSVLVYLAAPHLIVKPTA
jgi:hypothetical protein